MQVFPKSANYWSRGSIIALLFVLAGLGWMIVTLQRSDFVTTANQFIEQPVQFSHQHHAGGIGIDCRYCHTSVEQAAFAGIPPTKTCMNCHAAAATRGSVSDGGRVGAVRLSGTEVATRSRMSSGFSASRRCCPG